MTKKAYIEVFSGKIDVELYAEFTFNSLMRHTGYRVFLKNDGAKLDITKLMSGKDLDIIEEYADFDYARKEDKAKFEVVDGSLVIELSVGEYALDLTVEHVPDRHDPFTLTDVRVLLKTEGGQVDVTDALPSFALDAAVAAAGEIADGHGEADYMDVAKAHMEDGF